MGKFRIKGIAGNGSGQGHRAKADQGNQPQRASADSKEQAPEMREQLDVRVSRVAIHPVIPFVSELYRAVSDAPGDPEQCYVEINAIATISCQNPCYFTIDQSEAIEVAEFVTDEQFGSDEFRGSAQDVPEPTVRRRVCRLRIHQLKRCGQRVIQHVPNVCWILL